MAALVVLAASACGSEQPPGEAEGGTARLALSVVPADVSCVEVTATGTRQVIKQFGVAPQTSQQLEMAGLPIGDVQFSALAFAEACASRPQGATPTWISDPVVATIAKNVVAQVMLVMRRNGRVSVGIDFADCVAGFVDLGTLDGTATISPVDMNNNGQIVGTTATEPFVWSGGIMRPLGTGPSSGVVAINDKGQVAGTNNQGAFLWQDGVTYTIGTLGGSWSSPSSLNDLGQVVGVSATASDEQHAFIWQPGGPLVDLGTLGGVSSYAIAVGGGGQVVGESGTSAGENHAFLWQGGTMRDLGTLGGGWSRAADVNAAGQVVGSSSNAAGEQHAFIWEAGVMRDLGTLGGAGSDAVAINAGGQVIGHSNPMPGVSDAHAFVWAAGVLHDLGTFGGPSSALFGRRSINDAGEIVGQAETGPGELHAFLWRGGTLNDLGTFGVPNTAALGINQGHRIFGFVAALGGRQRGFFFDPNVCAAAGSQP